MKAPRPPSSSTTALYAYSFIDKVVIPRATPYFKILGNKVMKYNNHESCRKYSNLIPRLLILFIISIIIIIYAYNSFPPSSP